MKKVSPRWSTFAAERELLLSFIGLPGDYVIEIGAFRGSTTVDLARSAAKYGKRLIVIDPWNGYYNADETIYQKFLANTARWEKWISVVRAKSQDAKLSPEFLRRAALVFIDGDHAGEAPYHDMVKFWPYVAIGGVLALHDYFDAKHRLPVQRAVQRFISELPRPVNLCTLQPFPTPEELQRHRTKKNAPGVAWIKKVHG